MNQPRMLGRLRRRPRHRLSTRHLHTRDWSRWWRATGSGQGRCSHVECADGKGPREWKRLEQREWRRELAVADYDD